MKYSEKPWLKSYRMGPYRLDQSLVPYPKVPLYSFLDQSVEKYPTQTAVLFQDRALKYHQLKNHVDRLSTALLRLGLKKGDRACLFLPNSMEFVLGYWAIIKAGGVVVPTSLLRTDEGLLHEVKESGSRFAICQESDLERLLALQSKSDMEAILVASKAGYETEPISYSLPAQVHDLYPLIQTTDPQLIPLELDPSEDLCELAFTGGATGLPKGVMITHSNRVCAVLQLLPWMMKSLLRGLTGKASTLMAIPMVHTYGNFVHQSAISLGLRMIILPDPRDTQTMLSLIHEHRPFLVPGVPTQFMRLAEAGLKRSNTMLFSGSAPLPREVAQMIKQKTGMSVTEGYGLTETASVSHVNLTTFSRVTGFVSEEKIGIGVPCPDTECMLVDDNGHEVETGQPGELVLRGPQVMKGYWSENGAGLTADGWLHTGDVAIMDDDGYFQIVDRIKDMVNVSGMKVYTTQVDEVLFKHPGVLMAAAFGVPDPSVPGSERVMVVIKLKDEYRGKVTDSEICEFCRQYLPPYAVPQFVEFREDFPLTVTEKLFKKALREEAISKLRGH